MAITFTGYVLIAELPLFTTFATSMLALWIHRKLAKADAERLTIAELAEAQRVALAARTLRTAQQLELAIQGVRDEVQTGNSQTLGALADSAESRRIDLIPEGDRTHAETEHIDTVGPARGRVRGTALTPRQGRAPCKPKRRL